MTAKLSICVPFYPWYRQYDRSQEIFNVLIKSLNDLPDVEDIELCVVNAGVEDIWGDRKFDNHFGPKLISNFKGSIVYYKCFECIHTSGVNRRFWLSKAVTKAVELSTSDKLLLIGMDCYITGDFIFDYMDRVSDGYAWVIMSTKCEKVEHVKLYDKGLLERGYYTAKGIVGITKNDFYSIGGYNCSYIKDQSDSDFYTRLVESEIDVVEEFVDNVYHVAHPGSHMRIEKCQVNLASA